MAKHGHMTQREKRYKNRNKINETPPTSLVANFFNYLSSIPRAIYSELQLIVNALKKDPKTVWQTTKRGLTCGAIYASTVIIRGQVTGSLAYIQSQLDNARNFSSCEAVAGSSQPEVRCGNSTEELFLNEIANNYAATEKNFHYMLAGGTILFFGSMGLINEAHEVKKQEEKEQEEKLALNPPRYWT